MAKATGKVEAEGKEMAASELVSASTPNGVRSAVETAAAVSELVSDATPPKPFAQRLAAVIAAKNPLLEAAEVLLRAQADMPEKLGSKQAIATLRALLKQEIDIFQKLCEQANIRRDHVIGARYCLCTALDEAAMQTEWGKGGDTGVEWLAGGLATTFHEDRTGGEKVYLLIGRLLTDPHEHLHLLEVIFRILSFGFEGRYRHEAGGGQKHEAIRQRLHKEIAAQRGPVPTMLPPDWQSDVKGKRPSFFEIPVRLTVAVLSVILFGLFGWFKYELSSRSAEVQKQIADIGRSTLLHDRHAAQPALNLVQLLKNEIAAGKVSVDEDARHSSVTFRGDAMFQPGGASVQASIGPLIAKIAGEIAKAPGKVTVLGYTDNVPIRSRQFASNLVLSEQRAMQVMRMLQAAGIAANRLEAIGKGDADPVGDNRTAQGRAQNRRVAIIVAQ